MLNESDCEFFQDLVQWYDAPAQEEVVQSIDHPKSTDARAHNTDTLHTKLSPQGWETIDANSPPTHTHNVPSYPVPLAVDEMVKYNVELFSQSATNDKVPFQEQFLDFSSLPVVIGDLAADGMLHADPWQAADSEWQTTDYTKTFNTFDTMPFIHQDDSMDMKYVSVTPQEVESNLIVIGDEASGTGPAPGPLRSALSVDVSREAWPADLISTPEVVSFVDQLETEKCPLLPSALPGPEHVSTVITKFDDSPIPTPVKYPLPITPKTESESEEDTKPPPRKKRPRRDSDSDDSDESYTPYTETHRTRKVTRKAPKKDIKQMIQALEGAQQQPKKRGRPPGRRVSTVSTVSNNSGVSTHEVKYRELRDKNNEASKRSRMNRKLKELQMEQLADELEERNKKLKVRADLLEEMVTKLRKVFLSTIQKKAG